MDSNRVKYVVGICNLFSQRTVLLIVKTESYTEAMIKAVQGYKYTQEIENNKKEILKKYTTINDLHEYLRDYWNLSVSAPQKIR